MSIAVTVCDDSKIARKMMALSFPDGWDVAISYAEHGKEAIANIENGLADVLFLDLNMPIMDGYEVMEEVRKRDLPTMVIVVSGDVQTQARERMIALGVLEFIEKPIDNAKLCNILNQYGLYSGDTTAVKRSDEKSLSTGNTQDEKLDALQELANVAMGRAGRSLGKLVDEFIGLPVPKVNILHPNELQMALSETAGSEKVSAISKGFCGGGISGEAIIMFADDSTAAMCKLLGYSPKDENADLEALMDISNIIIGTCLNAISDDLKLQLTHNTPIILGMHCDATSMMQHSSNLSSKVLMIEIVYAIAQHKISFELLLLVPEQYTDQIFQRILQNGQV